MTRISPRAALLLAPILAGCEPPPIAWEEPVPAAPAAEVPAAPAEGNALRLSACPGGVRAARDTAEGSWYAVWWSVRPDSTADLVVARSADGVQWGVPVRVDTLDAGRTGCRRLPPSIAAHAGHVHVAYAMAAREGPGIFASHSMDQGSLFHSPVAVVYGERIGLTAIAARGDIVAVAYEDPNTKPRRIGLAFSRTMAHLFQSRSLVSPPTGESSAPGVSLGDRTVTVAWTQVPRGSAVPQRVARRGSIR